MTTAASTRLTPRFGAPPPRIPERLIPLLEAEAPRFSAAEMARRRRALADALTEAGASHALIVGTDRRMSALQWLTGWPSSNLNIGVFSPGRLSRPGSRGVPPTFSQVWM